MGRPPRTSRVIMIATTRPAQVYLHRLIAAGNVIGVIAAQSATPRAFSQEDLRRLTVLANQASGAIYNAHTCMKLRKNKPNACS